MAVYVSNIVIEQGYDFETTFELENSITNEPLDLSTYELPDAVIRKTYSSSNISATFSISEREIPVSLIVSSQSMVSNEFL